MRGQRIIFLVILGGVLAMWLVPANHVKASPATNAVLGVVAIFLAMVAVVGIGGLVWAQRRQALYRNRLAAKVAEREPWEDAA